MKKLLDIERCTLLVVDKQKWYLDTLVSPFLSGDLPVNGDVRISYGEKGKYVSEMDQMIVSARSAGVPVFWSRMVEGESDSPDNVMKRWTESASNNSLTSKDVGYEFCGIPPVDGEKVFSKVYPDTFSNVDFKEALKKSGRDTLVIVGGYAARCVLATAFGAQREGYHVFIPCDLVAPHPLYPEELDVMLRVIGSLVGYVVSGESISEEWVMQSGSRGDTI